MKSGINNCAEEIFLYQRLAIKEILILPEAKLKETPASALSAPAQGILLGLSAKGVY